MIFVHIVNCHGCEIRWVGIKMTISYRIFVYYLTAIKNLGIAHAGAQPLVAYIGTF